MLDEIEIAHHLAKHRGPNARAMIEHAMGEAQSYIDSHAAHYLGSVQQGIYRCIFLHTLERDYGERKNLMGTVQCLRELGEQINANRVKD